jgi:hypothetical protein
MDQVDARARNGRWVTLAIAAVTSASAVTIAIPATLANADPAPAPPAPSATMATPAPATPNAAPGQVDPNAAPPPPADPNASEARRATNAVGGFSFVVPAGWVESEATHLDYGSALLSKVTGQALPGQPPAVANDTRIVLGRLDQKLYASAETDNSKASARLASDMGEFFMPFPGTRINQETSPLNANGLTGSASYYEVKFSDSAKQNGQIWAGVVGTAAPNTPNASPPQRWFVVWLGTVTDPVDKAAAATLAGSIRPWAALPAPASPAPASPAPEAPASAPNVPPPSQPAGELSPPAATSPQTIAST